MFSLHKVHKIKASWTEGFYAFVDLLLVYTEICQVSNYFSISPLQFQLYANSILKFIRNHSQYKKLVYDILQSDTGFISQASPQSAYVNIL